jgi:hypothetical protein
MSIDAQTMEYQTHKMRLMRRNVYYSLYTTFIKNIDASYLWVLNGHQNVLHPHKNSSDVLFSNVILLILPKTDTNMKIQILFTFPFEKPR